MIRTAQGFVTLEMVLCLGLLLLLLQASATAALGMSRCYRAYINTAAIKNAQSTCRRLAAWHLASNPGLQRFAIEVAPPAADRSLIIRCTRPVSAPAGGCFAACVFSFDDNNRESRQIRSYVYC